MGYTQIVFTEQDLERWGLTQPGTRQVTRAEEQAFLDAESPLQKLGFDTRDKENWLRLWATFSQSPQTPINVANIVETAKVHRAAFAWRTAVQMEYDGLAEKFTPAVRDQIAAGLRRHGFEVDDEQDLLTNWNLAAQALIARGYKAATPQNIDLTISNLAASPQGYKLVRKRQQSQFNAAQAVEDQKNATKVERNPEELLDPNSPVRPLTGHFKAWHDANHSSAPKTAQDQQTEINNTFRTRAEALVNSLPAADQPEARELMQKAGGWGWPLVVKAIEAYAQGKQVERSTKPERRV